MLSMYPRQQHKNSHTTCIQMYCGHCSSHKIRWVTGIYIRIYGFVSDTKKITIVIAGFTGAGKSHSAKKAAKELRIPWNDSDVMIEDSFGMHIPAIFENMGETSFRNAEKDIIANILKEQTSTTILSIGGGALATKETRNIINSHGILIWLDISLESALRRIHKCSNRPLFQADRFSSEQEQNKFLQNLFNTRYEIFKNAADYRIDAELPLRDVVRKIIVFIKDSNLLDKR